MRAALAARRREPAEDAWGSIAKLLAPLGMLVFCGWLAGLGLHRTHEPHHLHQPDVEPTYAPSTPASR